MFALDTVPGVDTICVEALDPRLALRSEEITPLVESVIRVAMDRLDAEAAAAHAEAAAAVAAAVQRSTDLILAFDACGTTTPHHYEGRTPAELDHPHLPEGVEDPLGPEVSAHDAAQVYDLFWADIPADQPVRERLRRWAQRPPL